MKASDPQRSPKAEGVLIRLLVPAHRSRLRLIIMALLLLAWIAFLIGLYIETARKRHHTPPISPTSGTAGMQQVDSVSETPHV